MNITIVLYSNFLAVSTFAQLINDHENKITQFFVLLYHQNRQSFAN